MFAFSRSPALKGTMCKVHLAKYTKAFQKALSRIKITWPNQTGHTILPIGDGSSKTERRVNECVMRGR